MKGQEIVRTHRCAFFYGLRLFQSRTERNLIRMALAMIIFVMLSRMLCLMEEMKNYL